MVAQINALKSIENLQILRACYFVTSGTVSRADAKKEIRKLSKGLGPY